MVAKQHLHTIVLYMRDLPHIKLISVNDSNAKFFSYKRNEYFRISVSDTMNTITIQPCPHATTREIICFDCGKAEYKNLNGKDWYMIFQKEGFVE